jgi:hypothetical protein
MVKNAGHLPMLFVLYGFHAITPAACILAAGIDVPFRAS